jgi:thiosulfate reductase cytochrome b subunit
VNSPTLPQALAPSAVQPRWVRAMHWINASAFLTMLFSGWQVYLADPYWLEPPDWWPTLGGDLPGALQWHFAAMWVLVANGLLAVVSLVASGRFGRLYLPVRGGQLLRDARALLTGRLVHATVDQRSALQKVAYIGVMLLMLVEILSGLAIWKPVPLHVLASCLGGYEGARRVHLVGMAMLASFVVGHVLLALSAPQLLLAMLGIRPRKREDGS